MTEIKHINSAGQRTLADAFICVGTGQFTGQRVAAIIRPDKAGTGIRFLRRDLPVNQGLISARWYNISSMCVVAQRRKNERNIIATV